jgi:hypothetical protein
LVVWNASPGTQARTFLLADGSQLTFRGITVGTNHSYCFGNPFQHVAARIPGRLGEEWSGRTSVTAWSAPSNNVVFWFRVRKGSDSDSVETSRGIHDGSGNALYRFTFKDDGGKDVLNTEFYEGRNTRSGDGVMFVFCPKLSRASRTVRLKLTILRGPEDQEESAEFTASSPLYRKQP